MDACASFAVVIRIEEEGSAGRLLQRLLGRSQVLPCSTIEHKDIFRLYAFFLDAC